MNNFNYATQSLLLQEGDAYVGYYTVRGKTIYADRADYTETPLTSLSTFRSECIREGMVFDKVIGERLKLPYNIDSLMFSENQILDNKSIFTQRLNRLNYNTLYLYNILNLQNPILPNNYTASVSYLSGSTRWTQSSSVYSAVPFAQQPENKTYPLRDTSFLDFANDMVSRVDVETKDALFFVCTDSSLYSVSANPTRRQFTVLRKQTIVDDPDVPSSFKKLTRLAITDEFLFVLDTGHRTLHKYNIENFLSPDVIFQNKLIHIHSTGGKSYSSNTPVKLAQFNTPVDMCVSSNRVFVYDSSSKSIKVLDYDFNLVNNISVLTNKQQTVEAIKYNEYYNRLIVVIRNKASTQRKFITYNIAGEVIQQGEFVDTFAKNEKVLKILFSENNSTIFYLISTKRIRKKFIHKPAKTIGSFDPALSGLRLPPIWNRTFELWNDNPYIWNESIIANSFNIRSASLSLSNDDYDFLYILNVGRLIYCEEDNAEITNLDTQQPLTCYSVDDISIDTYEYIQPLTLNKELYKIIANIIQLKNHAIHRLVLRWETPTELTLETKKVIEKATSDLLKLQHAFNYYVNENEQLHPSVLNRILGLIYTLQYELLQITYDISDAPIVDTDSLTDVVII